MEGYLGCRKCIEEKRESACRIIGCGDAKMSMSIGASIKCNYHGTFLEYIEQSKEIEAK